MCVRALCGVTAAVTLSFVMLARLSAAPASLAVQMQAAYDAQCADLMHGDLDAFANTLSPNFTATQDGQTVTRSDIVAAFKTAAQQVKLTRCTTTIDSVSQSGNVITADVRQDIEGTATSHAGALLDLAGGKRDTWLSNNQQLIQTSSAPIWMTTSVNGTVVNQSGDVPPAPPLETSSPAPATSSTP